MTTQQAVFEKIIAERQRQDQKWGLQNHYDDMWFLIAAEEMGEIAKALITDTPIDAFEAEIVQTAAVLVAWLECRHEARDGQ